MSHPSRAAIALAALAIGMVGLAPAAGAGLVATEFAPPPPVPTRVDEASLLGPWQPRVAAQTLLSAEIEHWAQMPLTAVVPHAGGFVALRRAGAGWELLTSADGLALNASEIEGPFAAPDAVVALGGDDTTLTAAEAGAPVVLWRSKDGRRWQRSEVHPPWPVAAGLAYVVHGVDITVHGSSQQLTIYGQAIADWVDLLGVEPGLIELSGQATLRATVASGPKAGTYDIRLVAADDAVVARIVESFEPTVVVAERAIPGIDDPAGFVELFIACGGFTPMSHSWLLRPDGTTGQVPVPSSQVAAAEDATVALDEHRRLFLVAGDRTTSPLPRPEDAMRLDTVITTSDGIALVGHTWRAGKQRPAVWRYTGGGWELTGVARLAGTWFSSATAHGSDVVVVSGTDRHTAIVSVFGAGGRVRSHRLEVEGILWNVAVAGDTVVVTTSEDNVRVLVHAWRLEGPTSPAPEAR